MAQPLTDTLSGELREELVAGRWKRAVSMYERHLTPEEKADAEFRIPYAIALIRSGKVSSGLRILADLNHLPASSRDDIRQLLVKPLMDSGETKRAMQVLDALLARADKDVRDLRLRASLLGRQKRWAEAIADAAASVDIDPGDAYAHSQYILLSLQGGQVEQAGRHAAKTADLASGDARFALAAMLALTRSGRPEQAAILAREAAECEKMTAELAGVITRTLFETGHYQHAIDTGDRLLREGFDGPVLRCYLG